MNAVKRHGLIGYSRDITRVMIALPSTVYGRTGTGHVLNHPLRGLPLISLNDYCFIFHLDLKTRVLHFRKRQV